jgi:hypothetical protein
LAITLNEHHPQHHWFVSIRWLQIQIQI